MKMEMKRLSAFVQEALEQNRNKPDPHHATCCDTANEFDLWEDDRFPLWLSFVVQGFGRELGILI